MSYSNHGADWTYNSNDPHTDLGRDDLCLLLSCPSSRLLFRSSSFCLCFDHSLSYSRSNTKGGTGGKIGFDGESSRFIDLGMGCGVGRGDLKRRESGGDIIDLIDWVCYYLVKLSRKGISDAHSKSPPYLSQLSWTRGPWKRQSWGPPTARWRMMATSPSV